MDYFKRVFGASNANGDDPGIITVVPSSTTVPNQHTQTSSLSEDPLLRHLRDLQSKTPRIDVSSSSSSKAVDAESLLADVELVKQLSTGTGRLNEAVLSLLTAYQSWHNNHIQALTTNQEYIARTIDQAEAKAAKAVRHVQLQIVKLRTLSQGMAAAEGLPELLADVTATTAALEQQLEDLEQLAVQQEQQQAS